MRIRTVGGGQVAAIGSVFLLFACLSPLAHVHLSHDEDNHSDEHARAQSIYHVHLGTKDDARGEGYEGSAKDHHGEVRSVASLQVSARYSLEPPISVGVAVAATDATVKSSLENRYAPEIQNLPHGPPKLRLKPLRAPPLPTDPSAV